LLRAVRVQTVCANNTFWVGYKKQKRLTSEDDSRCVFYAGTSPSGKVSLTTKKNTYCDSFSLPGDRMRYCTHRNDDPPAMKLLPFAGNKICQAIDFVNGLR